MLDLLWLPKGRPHGTKLLPLPLPAIAHRTHHLQLENCPDAKGGVCFRCGENDHTTAKCKVNLPYGARKLLASTLG